MTEEPQLGSIQERIAALKQAQAQQARSGTEPPLFRPATQRCKSANNPPSYDVTGSVLDGQSIGNEPAGDQEQRPVVPGRPKKAPPPLPTRKSGLQSPPQPARPAARPALPSRRPTESSRRPSIESTTSDASLATTTSAGRGASTTSLDSNGGSRVKAPAWGTTKLPPLPPRRDSTAETNGLQPPSRPKSMRSISSLSSNASARAPSPSPPSLPTRPRPRESVDNEAPVPRLPPRPSRGEAQSNGTTDDSSAQPPRRLRPPASETKIKDARQFGFGGLNNTPKPPPRPNSIPSEHPTSSDVPPPVPRDTRPDLSKIQATKPRSHASMPSTSQVASTSDTECLDCHDFSGPDTHAARYPRESLLRQDLAWLARELTTPFLSLTDKARAIFTWLHHNISYDVDAFFSGNLKPSTPASTLSTGLAVCEGYAGLFAALSMHAGLEAVVVSGHGKGYGYDPLAPGSPVPAFETNHAWNAVRIDGGQWKLLDACWGAGIVNGPGQPYKQHFTPAMFCMSNNEFGMKHFPSNKDHFFRDDGCPGLSWEEYILSNPDQPDGVPRLQIYSDGEKHSIGRQTLHPAGRDISIYNTPGPLRFQFGLRCPHWTLSRHSRTKPGLFLLMIHGVDGRKDDRLPFTHVPGSGPGGGGEFWYVDVPDVRMLGAPGQKMQLAVLTKLGDIEDARGVTAAEYQAQVGRVGMAWAYISEWQLVR